MAFKLNELDPKLRARIESQMRKEDRARLGGIQGQDTQPRTLPLVSGPKAQESRPGRVAGRSQRFRIAIVGFRHRILDDDNFIGSVKPLRDAIAEWLGCDDSRRNIVWTSGQCQTSGSEGTAVRIETL